MTRKTLALAASAAVAGTTAVAAVAAHGQAQPTTQTITFSAASPAKRDMKQIDVRPRGISLGDRFLGAETLRRDGRPAGRALLDCTALDASYQGQACVVTLLTGAGQITAQGGGEHRRLPGGGGASTGGDEFAITGGTGVYAAASGTLRVRSSSKGDTIVAVVVR
jgi:hypothetical protein